MRRMSLTRPHHATQVGLIRKSNRSNNCRVGKINERRSSLMRSHHAIFRLLSSLRPNKIRKSHDVCRALETSPVVIWIPRASRLILYLLSVIVADSPCLQSEAMALSISYSQKVPQSDSLIAMNLSFQWQRPAVACTFIRSIILLFVCQSDQPRNCQYVWCWVIWESWPWSTLPYKSQILSQLIKCKQVSILITSIRHPGGIVLFACAIHRGQNLQICSNLSSVQIPAHFSQLTDLYGAHLRFG